jgi:hypothetical protein
MAFSVFGVVQPLACLLVHFSFFLILFVYLLAVWEFELRVSHILGRHSTTWAIPPLFKIIMKYLKQAILQRKEVYFWLTVLEAGRPSRMTQFFARAPLGYMSNSACLVSIPLPTKPTSFNHERSLPNCKRFLSCFYNELNAEKSLAFLTQFCICFTLRHSFCTLCSHLGLQGKDRTDCIFVTRDLNYP